MKIPSNGIFANYKFNIRTLSSSSGTAESSKKTNETNEVCEPPVVEKASVFQRMKQMTKDYWYILIPVHLVTSLGWAAIFYTAAKK